MPTLLFLIHILSLSFHSLTSVLPLALRRPAATWPSPHLPGGDTTKWLRVEVLEPEGLGLNPGVPFIGVGTQFPHLQSEGYDSYHLTGLL